MLNTMLLSFSLKNTYRVNAILHSLKQIPLLKRLLPDTLYRVRGLKIFANVLAALYELLSVFLFKFLYVFCFLFLPPILQEGRMLPEAFPQIYFFLALLGAFSNTFLFNPTKEKYYAVILMRMNARSYALANYAYDMAKFLVGQLTAMMVLGGLAGVPLWLCALAPLFAAGCKAAVAAYTLHDYEKTGKATSENKLGKLDWVAIGMLLIAAYVPFLLGWFLPQAALVGIFLAGILIGALSLRKVLTFREYRALYQKLLTEGMATLSSAQAAPAAQVKKNISADTGITSKKEGFEFLNELFIRRHQKILWKSSKRIAVVAACIFALLIGLLFFLPKEDRRDMSVLPLTYLPYFTFIMYSINRGTGFTQALFMNCDVSLLTYSFFKQPKMILRLFRIRLREIIKVNLLPAAVIAAGLCLILALSGGTDNPVNYLVLIVSILCLSVFFSVHYLTIYYLLQPYNAGTEMKNGTYRLVLMATYLICFILMQLRLPTLLFGGAVILFCAANRAIPAVLVYRPAPKTFGFPSRSPLLLRAKKAPQPELCGIFEI